MAVPKGKTSIARKNTRRSNVWKLTEPGSSVCPKCKEIKLPHKVCKACGFYNGKDILHKEA